MSSKVNYEEKILDIIVSDFLKVPKYIQILFLFIVFFESIRKYMLHIEGVPFFVLDNESIITTFSYGVIFISVLYGTVSYLVLYFAIKEKILIKYIDILIKIRKGLFLNIFGIVMFFFFMNKIISNEQDGIIYINKDYIVERIDKYSVITLPNNDNLILSYCKTGFIKDVCYKDNNFKD